MAIGTPLGFCLMLALLTVACALFYARVTSLLPFQSAQDYYWLWIVLISIILKKMMCLNGV